MPPIFGEIRRLGNVTDEEMARVFNLGLGMVVMVDGDSAAAALAALSATGVDAVVVGRVEAGERGVELVGAPFWSGGSAGAGPA